MTLDARDDACEAELRARIAFHDDVTRAAHQIRVREAARQLVAAETSAGAAADVATLAEMLARPADPPMRADGLVPSDASVLVVAARKTGKTTAVLGYARALLLGGEFLGRFRVRPLVGTVALLNYEVSGATVARWAHEHGIPPARLVLVNVRGRRNPLVDPRDRAALAATLRARQVEAVIVDPFGRAYTGTSQNDSGEVGAWLVRLDEWVRSDVGATDLVLTAHAGWAGERTRGSSALEDWADVIVTMTRSEDPDDDRRYLRAIGRDVDVDEDRIDYDAATRTLTLSGAGSRRAAKDDQRLTELVVLVERHVAASPGLTVRELEAAVRADPDAPSHRQSEVSRAAKVARDRGLVTIVTEGPGRPSRHYSTTPANPRQTPAMAAPHHPRHPRYIGGGVGGGGQDPLPAPDEATP